MFLLPATEEARIICEQFDELEENERGEKPSSPFSGFTTDVLPFALLALALVVVDTIIDLNSFINSFYGVEAGHQWWICLLGALVFTGVHMTFFKVCPPTEGIQERRLRQKYHELCQRGDIVEVHYKLVRRWSKIRDEVGIDTDEPRAYLEEFPGVVKQIVELRKTIKSLSGKAGSALQPELNGRITQIMQETLKPLALELKVARELEALVQEMIDDADRAVAHQRQLVHTVVTSMCSELWAQQLLRIT